MASSISPSKNSNFLKILPVLFYEYLAVSITKSILPHLLVQRYGNRTYVVVGCMETVKGILAFISCPFFGRLSDRIGRKYCLLVTVVGSTMPILLLVFSKNANIDAFVCTQGMSGFFSATFPLTFAYISDCVTKKRRAPAYGLALATFGLSFCIGPVVGSYLAFQYGNWAVFLSSFLLVAINVIYIITVLPETVIVSNNEAAPIGRWDLLDTFRVFNSDPFMRNLALIVFLYYTAVWALVSTLAVYVTRHLHFTPVTLGWLFSGYGLATMFSEAVLVRVVVPTIGETASIKVGLGAFAAQCLCLFLARNAQDVFLSGVFSILSNLVYPSISSLVSRIVDEGLQGEALGALNGIKALTEGFGPLLFGVLMGLFELSPTPGAPFALAAMITLWALLHCFELPDEPDIMFSKYRAAIAANNDETESALLLAEE